MKRIGKRLLTGILMALCALCLVLAACGKGEKIEFSFETNGGSPIETVYLEKGETYTLPIPQREGYDFEGWYRNMEFSGTPETEVVAEVSVKFYAKWEQLYEIKLELDGGTLATGKLYAKAGDAIYDSVKDLVPEKTGWQFGAWFMGDSELSRAAQVQAADVTLTAHYKVGYTVEIYKQNTDLEGYTKEQEDHIGYEYITATAFTPTVDVTGFELAATQPADAITSKVLTATPSQNVFRLYYDRKLLEVTFSPAYPDGQEGTPIQRQVYYGCETQLPAAEFSADGYFLYAWSAMNAEGNTTTIESDYIRSLLENSDDNDYSGTVTIGEYISFTALWSKGYTDMMHGVDLIYLFHEDDTVCYLERYGKYFEGEYTPNNRSALFYDTPSHIKLEARLKADGTFIYAVDTRSEQTFKLYTVEGGIHDSIQIGLDPFDGIIYQNGTLQSRGTYTIDEENNYHVTFTSGELQDQMRVLRFIQATVDGGLRTLFQFRNEEEYAMPVLQRALVAEQSGTNVVTYLTNDLLSIDLDGYGGVVMNTGDGETSNYYYSYEGDDLTLYNTNGRVYGVCKIITVQTLNGDVRCYIPYEEAMAVTYTASDNSTLRLDGVSEAVYTPANGTPVQGKYTYTTSIFGGNIITVALNSNTRYVFLAQSETVQNGEESTTTHTFELKGNGYAEYYHTDGNYINFTPIIVIEEMNGDSGRASVYGASGTSSQHVFHKVAEGAFTYNKNQKTYALTIDKDTVIEYPEGILETPIDLHNLDTIVFGVNSTRTNTATYRVSYWMSVKRTSDGDGSGTDLTTTYTGEVTRGKEKVNAQLTLVGGFAILKIGTEDWKVGSYSTSRDGVTTVNIGLTDTTSRFYVELTDGGDSKTFTHLDQLLGSARERNANGTANSDVTFEFDGKGGAILVTQQTEGDPTRVEGTLERLENVDGVEGVVYRFTPKETGDTAAFRFVLLTSGSSTYFTRETTGYSGEYTLEGGTDKLTLDGFGFRATFMANGETVEGVYAIVDDDEHIVRVAVGDENYFFDIKDRTYGVRGSEYGTYLFVVNYANDGYLLRLDGHGKGTLQKGDDGAVIDVVYTSQNGVYTLTLTIPTEVTGINAKYTGSLGEVIQNNKGYNAFLVEYSNARNIYVDRTEWNVLVLDGFGNAVRYGEYGAGERGTYIVLTDDLLYYVNRAATSACIYEYDSTKGEIVMREYEAQSYYTESLDALLFTQYGFMEFNDQTRYYYDIDGEGNVTIYRRAFGEANANEYGFLAIDIGKFGKELKLSQFDSEGFGDETYYSADGYAITFARDTTDKYDAEHFTYPVRVEGEDETLYALENLVFAPTGGDTFSVTATITINGKNYTGVVHRAVIEGDGTEEQTVEWYLTNGNFRFDLELSYHGADHATYKITRMRTIQTYQSNMYLDVYLMLLLMLGYQMPDSYGTLSLVTEYETNGTSGEEYITSEFGRNSVLNGYNLEHCTYEYDEKTGVYTVILPQRVLPDEDTDSGEASVTDETPADTHEYRLHFALQYNSTFMQLGYRYAGYTILGYTRVETLETDEGNTHYTVTAERVIYGETNNYRVGDYYSVTLETGTETKVKIASPDHLLPVGDKLYYVVYTRAQDEEKKITAAKYYELAFTEEDGGSIAEGEVKLLKSVAVRELAAEVYYTDLGSYVEVLTDGTEKKIVHVYYSQDYTVTECSYDATSKTFTVTTSTGRRLSIKITDETNKKIEITEITEEQA